MTKERIHKACDLQSHDAIIDGSKIHYLEAGKGDPILFLHGVPTSSHIWRNIIPHLAALGRCIAPDLIGFGRSDKPNIQYTIQDHLYYIEKLIEKLHLKNITFVMHGFGSLIGFDYAMRHEKNCKGLVFYEAYVRVEKNMSLPYLEQMQMFENEEALAEIRTNGVSFIDKIIPQNSMQQLPNEEIQPYRTPFLQKGSSMPLLQYLKETSQQNGSPLIDKFISQYSSKLMHSSLPKLMLYSVPGLITTIATAMWAKEHLPNLEIADLGEELHFAQESAPELMSETISAWLQGVEAQAAANKF